jgi:hypothetical protein
MAHARAQSRHQQALLDLERERARASMENERTPASIQAQLIGSLPEIMAKLPKPDELRTVTIGGADQTCLAGLIAQLAAVVSALRTATGDDRTVS